MIRSYIIYRHCQEKQISLFQPTSILGNLGKSRRYHRPGRLDKVRQLGIRSTARYILHRQTFHFSCGDTSILHFISALSIRELLMNFSPHKYFCLAQYLLEDIWHSICSACHFGRNRGPAAILADYHHSTNRLHRLGQPLKRGGEPDPPSLGGTTPPKRGVPVNPSLGGVTTQPDYMISPPPRMGGSMPLPNEPKLSSKRTPIKGGWSPLDPLAEPPVGGDSN